MHPENVGTDYEVLLSLLGVLVYKQKYPSGSGATGAPAQTPNNEVGSLLFSETGKRVGGKFLAYWQQHGGLAQQGYPISEEFVEKSALDGKTYKVQYFERAVFELHPENQLPYEVLLSQLGTFQYRKKYLQPSPTPSIAIATPSRTPLPLPSATSTIPINSCEGSPPTNPDEMFISHKCTTLFTRVTFIGYGFTADDEVGIWSTMPNGQILGAKFNIPVRADDKSSTVPVDLHIDDDTEFYGIWTTTMEGVSSHRKIYGYFRLVPYGTPLP